MITTGSTPTATTAAGQIGGPAEDYLGRSKRELEQAIAAARIVEVRSAPRLREFKANELTPGRFATLVDPDGVRWRVFRGLAFDKGRLLEHLPENVCGFVVRADQVIMLERAGSA